MDIIRNYTGEGFEKKALEIFRYQYENVEVYGDFVRALDVDPGSVRSLEDIPFLPVELFKTHRITDNSGHSEIVFESSGTTGLDISHHYVEDPDLYRESFTRGFEYFYGSPDEWCILALLPSYLERENSSLVFMADHLIKMSGHPESGFYLYEYDKLMSVMRKLQHKKQKTMLLGVSFALTDLAASYHEDLSGIVFIETGGMKGRKKEMVREEIHSMLKKSFGIEAVHSEYGMTELLSQAWSQGNGLFRTPPWMKIIIRDTHDPFSTPETGTSGLINIIDLANIHSCVFIATSDLGRMNSDGSFEVLGRMDNSDIRGCNLLIA